MIAAVRPHAWDFPLFLHVLGAMVLVGAVATAALLAFAAWRRPGVPVYGRAAFWSLLAVGVPAYVAMRIGAQWTYSKEGFSGDNDPTWIGIGFAAADIGLLLLLLTTASPSGGSDAANRSSAGSSPVSRASTWSSSASRGSRCRPNGANKSFTAREGESS